MPIRKIEVDNDKQPRARGYLCWINPGDKAQSCCGFNFQEACAVHNICVLGKDQIIKCYEYIHHPISSLDLMYLCGSCKYSCHKDFSCEYLERVSRTQHPYFIDDIVETVDTDEKKAGYFVYFISDGQFVKIGISNDVMKRLGDLQVGNPKPLTVLFSVPVRNKKDALELEYRLHNVYREFARCGEWFDILNYIKVEEFQNYFS